jgi:DNA mismatch repair protein MutL
MGIIRLLDDNMINMIAAGEVIERPASIVKELLENSLDAKAKKVTVRVEDGGKKFISITDDGIGMDQDDIQKAILPHATSKIKTSDDLISISTLGFRGEALASIASVSKLSIISRIADSIQANILDIDCGQSQPIKPSSADYGSTITVRDLFYKLPARRKFLKTTNTEIGHITEQFTRIALAHIDLDMTLIHNGRQLYRLPANTPLAERIEKLLGKKISADLIEVQQSEKNNDITALIAKPMHARSTTKFQYTFLNGRYIRDKFISHAIKEAYRGLLEPNRHPVAFIFLKVPADSYDVNVHPTKIEVRFENANLIHSQVLAVLREKLLSMDLDVSAHIIPPAAHLADSPPADQSEQARKQRIREAMAGFFQKSSSVNSSQQHLNFTDHSKSTAGQNNFPNSFNNSFGLQTAAPPPETKCLQLHNSYIVTQTDDGFMVIDQHALHERIIYEGLCRKINEGRLESQRLLIPETFELTDFQAEALKDNSKLITKLGIELEDFGPKTMAIQSFPAVLNKVNPLDFMTDLIDKLTEKDLGLDAERLLHEVLDMAACKAAIKAGQPLTDSEIEQLLRDKDAVERTSRCPHGRPTTIKFSINELEKQFKRTGF